MVVGRYGRLNSPPASSVMDLIFCRSDGSHACPGWHLSLLRSSLFASPRWCHIFLPTYSWSHLLTYPNYINLAFLYLSVMFSTLNISLMSSFMIMSWYLSVWPHANLHIFISVTSSFFTWSVSKPCLPLYSLYWRLAPTQCRQWTMCSTSALDGIDRNQPSAES